MPWTEKHPELLVSGLVGVIGAVIGSATTGLWLLLWRHLERRRKLQADLARFRRLIQFNDAPHILSDVLAQMRTHLLNDDALLERESVRTFFDSWLTGTLLTAGRAHSRLSVHGANPASLKQDAGRLLGW